MFVRARHGDKHAELDQAIIDNWVETLAFVIIK